MCTCACRCTPPRCKRHRSHRRLRLGGWGAFAPGGACAVVRGAAVVFLFMSHMYSRNTSPGPTLPPGPAKANCVLKFEYTRALRRGSQTQFVTELCSQKMSDREANAESKSKSRANGELVPMRHALLAVHASCVLPSRLTPPHTGHVTRTRTRRVAAIQCYLLPVHGIQL